MLAVSEGLAVDDRKQRFRLGLFVAAAGAMLIAMVLLFGGAPQRFFARTDTYTIIFDDAPGVSPGTPVRKSGVRIGEVSSVRLDDATGKVHVVIRVNRQYTIRQNEEPVISQDLLSRDTTIDFVPKLAAPPKLPAPEPAGEPKLQPPQPIQPAGLWEQDGAGANPPGDIPLGEPIPPGSVIRGRPASDSRALLTQASDILPTVQAALQAIRRSAERFEQILPQLELGVREFAALGRAIREAVPEVRRTNDELRALLQNVRTIAPGLRRTNEELQLTLRNFSQVGETVNVFIQANQDRATKALDQSTDVLQRISQLLSDENQKNITATLRAAQAASANFDSVLRNADDLLREGKQTVANINQVTKPLAERGERVLRNLDCSIEQLTRILVSMGGSGDGTIQKFFNDPSLFNNLNDAALMITRVIPRLDRILRDFEVFADKIARHPESIGIGGAIRPSAGLKESPTLAQPQPYRQRP